MKNKSTCALIVLSLAVCFGAQFKTSRAESFAERREKLLDRLTDKKILELNPSDKRYSYRVRWQYYHACLAKGIRIAEANRYFANSKEIIADEWPVLIYIRTYFRFKDTLLDPDARRHLRKVLRQYKDKFDHPKSKSPERYGVHGNHSIVAFSAYLLLDQEFGEGPKHKTVRRKFIDWVKYQGKYGRDEVNSPHYLDRSLLPLLNIYDFSTDEKLKRWAHLAIDQMVADFAVLSLRNVRGGPWCRAHQNHAPGVAEHNDATQDSFYVAGYQFFGHSQMPEYLRTHQILNYGFVTTTDYRPPKVVLEISDSDRRVPYEYKSHRRPVRSSGAGYYPRTYHEWDMYYYITPAYSLGSVQARVELDNHVTARKTRDFVNTQVWELTFTDPHKILGPKRNLNVSTGEVNNLTEINANTANMQYKNVLFYKGEFMDYNHNLTADGGEYVREKTPKLEYHFWRVSNPAEVVFVGIIHFPLAKAGILEVAHENEFDDFRSFRKAVKDTQSACKDTGKETSYTSTKGDTIIYTNTTGQTNKGEAVVNGENRSLHEYPLYSSPYIRSEYQSGIIRICRGPRMRKRTLLTSVLMLDFRSSSNPVRTESILETSR